MTGAIEFLKVWRDICNKSIECKNCPITACRKNADVLPPMGFHDEMITELVRQVMAETRKKVDEE